MNEGDNVDAVGEMWYNNPNTTRKGRFYLDFSRLTAFLDSLPEIGIPGTDCIVVQNHQQIYRHRSGYADVKNKKPATPDTLYHIYSASKVVTCAAALQLYEQGLSLIHIFSA